ncbi:MAG: helix-turn-helix domain-containing protein [Actinomycetota bacterium]|nr:helix-turn-helix domain-containing protein [Actinomycetota bacterium]
MMQVYTIDEARVILKVSRDTVRRLISRGRIKCVRTGRYGGRVLISERALEEFMLGEGAEGGDDEFGVRI